MGIGASLFLIAVGAILAFAVTAEVSGLDIEVVGWILMALGGGRDSAFPALLEQLGRMAAKPLRRRPPGLLSRPIEPPPMLCTVGLSFRARSRRV